MAKSSAAPATLPWRYEEASDEYTHIVRDSGNEVVAHLPQDRHRAETHARFIVRSCNAHQALYEALSALTNLLQKAVDGQLTLIDSRYAASGYGGKTVTENIHAARAALALADAQVKTNG